MAGKQKKRRWPDEEKRSICFQTTAAGVSVAQVTRRYAMNANLIFKWLKDERYTPDADAVPDNALLPLGHYLAGACAASFGQQTDQALLNWAQWGREQLLILDSEEPHYTPLEVQAY